MMIQKLLSPMPDKKVPCLLKFLRCPVKKSKVPEKPLIEMPSLQIWVIQKFVHQLGGGSVSFSFLVRKCNRSLSKIYTNSIIKKKTRSLFMSTRFQTGGQPISQKYIAITLKIAAKACEIREWLIDCLIIILLCNAISRSRKWSWASLRKRPFSLSLGLMP